MGNQRVKRLTEASELPSLLSELSTDLLPSRSEVAYVFKSLYSEKPFKTSRKQFQPAHHPLLALKQCNIIDLRVFLKQSGTRTSFTLVNPLRLVP